MITARVPDTNIPRCPPVSSSINTFGQVPEYLGVTTWSLALLNEILCVAALFGGWFTAWLCGIFEPIAKYFELTGIATAVAAIGVLLMLLQDIGTYQACREGVVFMHQRK